MKEVCVWQFRASGNTTSPYYFATHEVFFASFCLFLLPPNHTIHCHSRPNVGPYGPALTKIYAKSISVTRQEQQLAASVCIACYQACSQPFRSKACWHVSNKVHHRPCSNICGRHVCIFVCICSYLPHKTISKDVLECEIKWRAKDVVGNRGR